MPHLNERSTKSDCEGNRFLHTLLLEQPLDDKKACLTRGFEGGMEEGNEVGNSEFHGGKEIKQEKSFGMQWSTPC